jgi:hypothetical protein
MAPEGWMAFGTYRNGVDRAAPDCVQFEYPIVQNMCMQFDGSIVEFAPSGERAMSVAAKAEPGKMSDAEVVEAYLTASMIPDPDAASAYMKPGTIITFTGGREFDHPRGPTGFNARRYRWVKKKMDRFDVCPGAEETVVYSIGTLYGEWIDGTPFEGNRYVDRFVVRGRQIVKMDVWNDSAERILVQRGIEA